MPDVDPEATTVNYLKRLRQENESTSAHSVPAPKASPATISPESIALGIERRRHPRYKCAGSVELRKEGTTVRTWGTFTDVSQSGCYVELQATFPPETRMELLLELNQTRVRVKAVVRVTYPFLGMGLAFTELSGEDRVLLGKLLECVAGMSQSGLDSPSTLGPEKRKMAQGIPTIQDHRAALDAVRRHFDHAENLSRERFWSLLRTSQSQSG